MTKGNAQLGAAEGIESRQAWLVATAVLAILTISYGAPLVASVALKEIALELGTPRSTPALAGSLVWLGFGFGSLGFGWIAERIGYRRTVAIGGIGIGLGLAVSAMGGSWQLLLAHALLVGVLGWGAINVTLMVYISRWFDRRRGSALAYVTNGQYIAGAVWPLVIAFGIESIGWRSTMTWTGIVSVAVVVPVALLFLVPAPAPLSASSGAAPAQALKPTGMPQETAFWLLCLAGFLCCVPMAMPSAHIVALCTDLGMRPALGAMMLSVLLGSAILTRQLWGWLSDRIGGLATILAGSTCQAVAIAGIAFAENEPSLIAVSAIFGMGYSGIIPAYVLSVREMFRAEEAVWRMPVWFFCNVWGMALGGWFAGLVYDWTLSYRIAFLAGLGFNIANILLVAFMLIRQRGAASGSGSGSSFKATPRESPA